MPNLGGLRGAGDEIRTHDNHVGNVVLYQLSYTRLKPAIPGSLLICHFLSRCKDRPGKGE